MYAFRPVIAGLWQHKDLIEGFYTLDDLLDIHEVMDLKEENQQRGRAWAEQHRK